MGGASTFKSAMSHADNGKSSLYDLRSWQGLTDVLRIAKEVLPPREHALFRDLVLQYAQRGGDSGLRAKIDAVLAHIDELRTHKNGENEASIAANDSPKVAFQEVVATRPAIAPQPTNRRPAPRFLPTSLAYETEEDSVDSAENISTDSEQKRETVVAEEEEKESTEKAVLPTEEESLPELETGKTPFFEERETEGETSVTSEREESVVVTPEAPQKPTPTGMRSLEEHKSRILEIKRLVNERIGNPVALVGVHKELGRAYMQALLVALKATGGGGTGIESAMQGLEDAYDALFTETTKSKPEQTSESKPVSPPSIERAHDPAPVIPKPVFTKEPVSVPLQKAEAVHGERDTVVAKKQEQSRISIPTPTKPVRVPLGEEQKKVHIPVTATPASIMRQTREEKNEASFQPEAPTPSVPQPPRRPQPPVMNRGDVSRDGFSETKYTQKKIGSALPQNLAEKGIDPNRVAVQQSELVSPEITQALHELLHEWSIFASSGIFGTGPAGSEHPLYIKLAPLSMGEVITGRYEGADRQINNVIHDYVNAWRHEQGIAYLPSETFEHFLRRVVQRIQKRQRSGS